MSVSVSTPVSAVPTPSKAVDRTAYLQALLDQDSTSALPKELQGVKSRARARLQDQALPTTRDEDWRFTDLAPLYQTMFQAAQTQPETVNLADLAVYDLPDIAARVVFVNGIYAPHLSTVAALPAGVHLQTAADMAPELQAQLGQQQGSDVVFSTLNTAKFADVAVLRIARNQVVAAPIQVIFVAVPSQTPTVIYPRCFVIAESGSAATLIEDYVTLGEGPHWTNAVTEITLAANAQLQHHRIQRESQQAVHVGTTAITQARDSRYRGTLISLGGQISRHNPELVLTGPQTETTLNGLTVAVGQQLADTHSAIAFTQPDGSAQQIHKCIVADRARAVFNGKIVVPKAAQQTNASQLSRNLLLSPKARVDTKPQLEIVADNVKCAHGATVSQLDEEEVFYLQSRGLNRTDACNLLVEAFATETIDQLPLPTLRQQLLDTVLAQIQQ